MRINISDTNSTLIGDNIEVSIKPKMIVFALAAVFWCFGQFYYSAAMRSRSRVIKSRAEDMFSTIVFFSKLHAIPQVQQSLMELKLHYIYGNLLVAGFVIDQLKNITLQIFYKELGPEVTFNIWWASLVLENLGKTSF